MFIVITFWILGFIRLKEKRYLMGIVQFLRVELVMLIETFIIGIVIAVLLKETDYYSRVWLISTFSFSIFSAIFSKAIFDRIYIFLITSNVIQRNILLVGDPLNCQNIIKKFPKKISNSIIKCLITIDSEEKDTYYYGIPRFNLSDDLKSRITTA